MSAWKSKKRKGAEFVREERLDERGHKEGTIKNRQMSFSVKRKRKRGREKGKEE